MMTISSRTNGTSALRRSAGALAALVLAAGALAACARSMGPLPGDSVSADGGVTLSPPRLSAPSHEAREAREELGPVESRLFPPELVMDHQAELGLAPEQRAALVKETERGHAEMARLQWDLQAEKEKLVTLLDRDRVDEAKVQQAAARVMEHESKVKSSHLAMLVRIKNALTPEQQAKLRAIRANARASIAPTSSSAPASMDGGLPR